MDFLSHPEHLILEIMKKINLVLASENLYMFHESQTGDFYCRQWGAIEGSRLRYDIIKQYFKNIEDDLERNNPGVRDID